MKAPARTIGIYTCFVLLLTQAALVRAASSASSSLSPEELLQSIEASESARRARRNTSVSAPPKALTAKQKAGLRERKRKQFLEMLSKLQKARESIRKQIELRQQKKSAETP